MKHAISTVLLFFSALALFGQEPDLEQTRSALPDPVVPRMPQRAAWQLTIKASSKDEEKSAKTLSTTTVYKDGKNYLLLYSPSLGGVEELWLFDGAAYIFGEGVDGVAMVNKLFYPMTNFTQSDFEPFSWIKKKHLVQVKETRGRTVGFFKAALSETLSARDYEKIQQLNLESEIDQTQYDDETGLPLDEQKSQEKSQVDAKSIAGEGSLIAAVDLANGRPLFVKSPQQTVNVKILSSTRKLTPPREIGEYLERQARKLKQLRASGGRIRN